MTFLSDLKDKQVLIFGAGVTGKSTEVFLKEYGCKITVIDEKGTGGSIRNFKDISLQDFNLAVVSPGWRLNHPLIELKGMLSSPRMSLTSTSPETAVSLVFLWPQGEARTAAESWL